MSSNIRYLSQHSLAVYETVQIERFAEAFRRQQKIQTLTALAWAFAFVFLAVMTVFLPVSLQGFLNLLIP